MHCHETRVVNRSRKAMTNLEHLEAAERAVKMSGRITLAHVVQDAREEITELRGARGRWLVWSMEHRRFWGPNWNGYELKREDAGRYTFEEALAIVRRCGARTRRRNVRTTPTRRCCRTMYPESPCQPR